MPGIGNFRVNKIRNNVINPIIATYTKSYKLT